ncbi:MAG: MAPEG family protein [Bacteriovorax sp.]|nr:MAPEG family protein [Bacteriovorax sp.]
MVLSIELKMLLYSVILGLVQLMASAQAATKQKGISWNLSARDQKGPELAGVSGRLDRAFKNFMETFPFFMTAILVVQITTLANPLSNIGAQLYFWARVVYVPLYAFGIPVFRTLVWIASLIGIILVLSALL